MTDEEKGVATVSSAEFMETLSFIISMLINDRKKSEKQ